MVCVTLNMAVTALYACGLMDPERRTGSGILQSIDIPVAGSALLRCAVSNLASDPAGRARIGCGWESLVPLCGGDDFAHDLIKILYLLT